MLLQDLQQRLSQAGAAEPSPIYFGGSFNPFHNGHAAIVASLHRLFPQAPIVLLPNHISPLKIPQALQIHPRWPTVQQKGAMMAAALSDLRQQLGSLDLRLEDCELQAEGVSYTADTVRRLRRTSCAPVCLALGWDSFASLAAWKDCDYLQQTCLFLVFQRRAAPEVPEGPAADILQAAQYVRLELDVPYSSSQIRRLYAAGAEPNALLGPQVAAYIAASGLYR